MRIPKHIGVIPDGNRRWAQNNGMSKEMGYDKGLNPGLELFRTCKKMGVEELTYYGFTVDNTKRPSIQTNAFTKACVDAVKMLENEDASLLVVGNHKSPMFPEELKEYTTRKDFGKADMKVNFLVNYGWNWDLGNLKFDESTTNRNKIIENINSKDISRLDLIIRWGGRRRLSGFLPVQSIYADFYVVDDYWPDFKPGHIHEALNWYETQDVTLGG
ncbi:polyprenyl diphosphate synthase [Tepidibacter sp. Z1-5]|uniref:polyprenyl diphosphate synthase n=1 Tax=Tepidibacter sp. Z1-5 TaxID=3134138 RepID=UPI0030C0B18A